MSGFFNRLTPAQLERLAWLGEELAEAGAAIGKIIRHGLESRHPDGGETNREWLERELGHVEAAQSLLAKTGDLDAERIRRSREAKTAGVLRWMHHN